MVNWTFRNSFLDKKLGITIIRMGAEGAEAEEEDVDMVGEVVAVAEDLEGEVVVAAKVAGGVDRSQVLLRKHPDHNICKHYWRWWPELEELVEWNGVLRKWFKESCRVHLSQI
jgi:hypothetical protein